MNDCGGKAKGLALLDKLKVPVPKWMALPWAKARDISGADLDDIIAKFDSKDKLAVRSSAANEDGAQKSFAGLFESKLNVPIDKKSLKSAIDAVILSGNAVRVVDYDNATNDVGVVIQKMINPVLSGVAFTSAIDTDGTDIVLIEVTAGLGDKLVSGLVTPTQIKIPVHDNVLDTDNISFA